MLNISNNKLDNRLDLTKYECGKKAFGNLHFKLIFVLKSR